MVLKSISKSIAEHHLPCRLTDKWQNKKTALREKLGALLKEPSLAVRKALAQVCVWTCRHNKEPKSDDLIVIFHNFVRISEIKRFLPLVLLGSI